MCPDKKNKTMDIKYLGMLHAIAFEIKNTTIKRSESEQIFQPSHDV